MRSHWGGSVRQLAKNSGAGVPARLYRPMPDHFLVIPSKKTLLNSIHYSHKLPWFVLNLFFSANCDSKAGHLSNGLTSHEVTRCCQLKLRGYLKQPQWFLLLLFGSFKKSLSQHCNYGNTFCLFELSAVQKWFHAYSEWWMLDGCKSNPWHFLKQSVDDCNEARHWGFQ